MKKDGTLGKIGNGTARTPRMERIGKEDPGKIIVGIAQIAQIGIKPGTIILIRITHFTGMGLNIGQII